MKYQIPESIIELANNMAKIKGLKTLLKPFYYSYKNFLVNKRNKYFMMNAKQVLNSFDKSMNEGGYFYTLAFGTLLGAVREKGFIKHDLDIDVFMWAEDWNYELQRHLEKSGFNLVHRYLVGEGSLGREETYAKDDISIDIFYIYPAVELYPYCCDFLSFPDTATARQSMSVHGAVIARRIELPIKKERIYASFENLQLYIPKNFKEILTFRYGPDYMIPNHNWTIHSHDNHIVEWTDNPGILVI